MKINRPNPSHFNPYKNHIQKQTEIKKEMNREDQIEISSQAKQLQENEKPQAKRSAYVQKIKDDVESGDYQVDPDKIAGKMIDFWSKQ